MADGLSTAPPPRRRGCEAAVAFGCLVGWMAALAALAAWAGTREGAGPAAAGGMAALFLAAWALAEHLVHRRGMVWPGATLGLAGPICLGFAASLLTAVEGPPVLERQFAVTTATAAAGMVVFLFRFRQAGLVSPVVTFTTVALFLSLRGLGPETLREVQGFSPRGILAALVEEPLHMAFFGGLAVGAMAFARWLDLKGEEFGMASARPLHIIGTGVTALVAGRLAAGLAWPLDLAVLLGLLAGAMAWGLRLDRIGVMATAFFALTRPLVEVLLQPGSARLDMTDWALAHMAMLGLGLTLWPVLRRRTVAAGFTKKPRHIRWNWPDRVIYPYRPPPGYR